MKRITTLLLSILLLINAGCKDACDCFHGAGDVISEERSVGQIREIQLRSNADVIVHSGEARLKVTAGSKLISKLETEINGDVMIIRNKNKCNWVRDFDPVLQIDIWTNSLDHIYVDNASGDITFQDTIHCNSFSFDSYSSLGTYRLIFNATTTYIKLHNGPADFYASGIVKDSYVYDAGFGKMHLENLYSENTFMNNRGTNDVYVRTSGLLDASLEGAGDIYYSGPPAVIKQNITGTGHLIPIQ